MSTPPPKPKFITNITWVQKILAGVAGSNFLIALLTLVPWIGKTFFTHNELLLSNFRMYMALSSFMIAAYVGVPQIISMIQWAFDFYSYAKKFKEVNNKDKKE